MRVVLDTNTLISMIFFPSKVTHEFTNSLADGNNVILIPDYVIDEIRVVVDRKFSSRKEILEKFFYELPFEMIFTPKNMSFNDYPEIRDAKDFPILAVSILNNALKLNTNVAFAVLTGCLRISKESIFTGLNNLDVYGISDPECDDYFGFNENEVDDILAYCQTISTIVDVFGYYVQISGIFL